MFNNKKILVLGMARSGYEDAKLLSNYENEIIVTDAKEQDSAHLEELTSLGVKFILSSNPELLLDNSFENPLYPGDTSKNFRFFRLRRHIQHQGFTALSVK